MSVSVKRNSTAEVSEIFRNFKAMLGWVCKPANYWKRFKVFQIISKNLVRSSIAVA